MDDDAIIMLANACFDKRDSPTIWLITLVYAALKRGKSGLNADDLRTIGAESKGLKTISLLAFLRMTRWAETKAILPPSQNGFRKGYRTTNNAFLPRCLIDKARSLGKTLYVATVDISNAFPSTDRATLWLKLRRLGMQGKIHDWLRALYAGMRYIVTNRGEESSEFESTIGILIGDTLSPLLFLIYLADFSLPPHRDDLDLNGTVISHLEHADDLLLISCSPEGLQAKMNSFYHWCRVHFMIINAMKSFVCIHGPRPRTIPSFQFGPETVDVVPSYTYLGVRFQSDARNMFAEHYHARASKSSAAAHAVLHIDAMVEELPPSAAKLLYSARIDPLLTYGCEIMPDVDDPLIEELSGVQSMFLRRSLGVYDRSALAPLYTETGIFPLRFRRIDMTLRYLQYALARPPDTLVAHALQECLALTARGHQGWLMDIQLVILKLRSSVTLPNHESLTVESVETCRLQVLSAMRTELQVQIDTNKKLYLLRNRTGPVLALRPYLELGNGLHRKAITRLLFSCHSLAVERLRWTERYRGRVDYDDRLCRMCTAAVETPEHVLLLCPASAEIVDLRSKYFTEMKAENPALLPLSLYNNFAGYLRTLLSLECSLERTAEWIHKTLELVYEIPMRIPDTAVQHA